MLSFKQFIADLERDAATVGGDVVRTTIFGLDVAAVVLPNEPLSRMNALWDLLGEREALVIAVRGERLVLSLDDRHCASFEMSALHSRAEAGHRSRNGRDGH
ncbi:MAG: hypothetical protein ACM3OF_14600 [Gemmatimonas sp.]